MKISQRTLRPFLAILTLGLLAALLAPFATTSLRAGLQSIALAPGDRVSVTCETQLSGITEERQATLECAAPAPPPVTSGPQAPGPVIDAVTGMSDNQTIGGVLAIEAQVSGAPIEQVIFELEGPQPARHTERRAPYYFMGDDDGQPRGWDTTSFPDGHYTLRVIAVSQNQQSSSVEFHISIANAGAVPEPTSLALPTTPPESQPPTPTAPSEPPAPQPLPVGEVFREDFSGSPGSPQPFQSPNWDVSVYRRAETDVMEPMNAGHGMDCGSPPAAHEIHMLADTVFICRDHLMTSLNMDDYGTVFLTPNRMLDLSQGEAVIRFDVSTERTSLRDWIDVWVSPYDDNIQLARSPSFGGQPRRGVEIEMNTFNGKTIFKGFVSRDFNIQELEGHNWAMLEDVLTPSATTRTTFELRLSRTHVKFGIPSLNVWWVDAEIEALDWERGVVQFGHHSYNPTKDCDRPCAPNTWHWDNITMAPTVPFTIDASSQRIVSMQAGQTVTLAQPSPDNAHLRFAGAGQQLEYSIDGSQTWLQPQTQQFLEFDFPFHSYWTPIPAGVTEVRFRDASNPDDPDAKWMVRDVSVWSPN